MIGSSLAADKDGKIVAKKVINKEKKEIINIYPKFISEGIWLKKYTSSGNNFILNIFAYWVISGYQTSAHLYEYSHTKYMYIFLKIF